MVYTKAELTMWGMAMRVVRDEGGVWALYRGLVPTALGVAPYVGEWCANGVWDAELMVVMQG